MDRQQFPHRAEYDADGNIVLPSQDGGVRERPSRHVHIEDVSELIAAIERPMPAPASLSSIVRSTIDEGRAEWVDALRQTREQARSFAQSIAELPTRIRDGFHALCAFAATPIPVPSMFRGGTVKPRSRGVLFLLDTIRFGGTFAAIFLALFFALNGQSYWLMVSAKLALGDELKIEQGLATLTRPDSVGADQSPGDRTGAAADRTSLLAFLPRVGPPDNRLIIPKIAQNVPVIDPPIDSLLKEDWKQFDRDIQTALLDGSVHYPGSARPGQAGNFFVTAHSSYYPGVKSDFKDTFARLPELDVGDTYSVYYGGDLHTYRVIERKIVKPTNVSILDQPTDRRLSTLMTCYPVGTTFERIADVAEEIDPETGEVLKVGQRSSDQQLKPAKVEMLPI